MYTEDQIKQALIDAYYTIGPVMLYYSDNGELLGDWPSVLNRLKSAQQAGAADRDHGAQPSTVDEDRDHEVRGG